jgi:division/cell wall cluster transcriptional repressor MraZ
MLYAKGPYSFGEVAESVGDTLVITLGLLESTSAACLPGRSMEEWERFSQKLSALPVSDTQGQAIRRKLYSMAAACEIDKQGRILIPAQLRELTGLSKDATLIGVGERVEIWNPKHSRLIRLLRGNFGTRWRIWRRLHMIEHLSHIPCYKMKRWSFMLRARRIFVDVTSAAASMRCGLNRRRRRQTHWN